MRYLQYTEQREQHLKEVKVSSMCTCTYVRMSTLELIPHMQVTIEGTR